MRLTVLLFLFMWAQVVRAQPAPKVILVIADGIPADVIERLKPPAMQQIISRGAYKRSYVGGIPGTYTETPTISAPGYNQMLTGTWGYKNNVWNNENQDPNYHYPSIFRLFKTARPKGTTAIFSTWIDNRIVLLGEGLPQTGYLKLDYTFDGYEKDTMAFPHDNERKYVQKIDEYVVKCADSVIRHFAPDLSWIYLEYTDDVGHAKGTGAAFDSAVLQMDNYFRTLSNAMQYREAHFNENWLLVFTTDHGRDSIRGQGHGGQSERERTTFIMINKPVTNAYFATANPAVVDILPSVANFLNIKLQPPAREEIDGVPFIGKVSISNARIEVKGDSLSVFWDAFDTNEEVSIAIAYTNNVKDGGKDKYQELGKANSFDKQFRCKVKELAGRPFYKVLVRGRHNDINVWHTEPKQ